MNESEWNALETEASRTLSDRPLWRLQLGAWLWAAALSTALVVMMTGPLMSVLCMHHLVSLWSLPFAWSVSLLAGLTVPRTTRRALVYSIARESKQWWVEREVWLRLQDPDGTETR